MAERGGIRTPGRGFGPYHGLANSRFHSLLSGINTAFVQLLCNRKNATVCDGFVIGTVRVLDDAAEAGLVDLPAALPRLQAFDIIVAGVAEEEQDDSCGRAMIALWVFGFMWPCARYGGCG